MNDMIQRPVTVDEVIIKKEKGVSGTVTVLTDSEGTNIPLLLGTVVTTTDGGVTWNSLENDIWVAGEYSVDDEFFHNGHLWKSLVDTNAVEPSADADTEWQDLGEFDACGILSENVEETSKAPVLVTGDVREKYLLGYDESMRHSLFKNKIILR